MPSLCGMSGEMVRCVLAVVLERSGMAEQCVCGALAHAWGVMQCEQSECVVSKEQ